jgi:hypothetical protein
MFVRQLNLVIAQKIQCTKVPYNKTNDAWNTLMIFHSQQNLEKMLLQSKAQGKYPGYYAD